MIILDHEQGTEAWHLARLGKPSASGFSKLITSTGKPSASAQGYISQLISERIMGAPQETFQNEHMARGTALEPEARETYEFITGNTVDEVGFILGDTEEYGCSPDGLIGEDGGLEIKCPAPHTHVSYLRKPERMPSKYRQQVQGCLWVTGRSWWDFFSYHPDMPHLLVRVERDEAYIEMLAGEVISAVTEIQTELEKLI
jgi:hypothetical protein